MDDAKRMLNKDAVPVNTRRPLLRGAWSEKQQYKLLCLKTYNEFILYIVGSDTRCNFLAMLHAMSFLEYHTMQFVVCNMTKVELDSTSASVTHKATACLELYWLPFTCISHAASFYLKVKG